MYQTYLRPLTAYNYLLRDWDRVEDAGPAHLLYEDLSRRWTGTTSPTGIPETMSSPWRTV